MLRLAHRILQQHGHSPVLGREMQLLRAATVVVVDSDLMIGFDYSKVADTSNEDFNPLGFLPNIAPPFDSMFVEYSTAHLDGEITQIGCAMSYREIATVEKNNSVLKSVDDNMLAHCRWLLLCAPWFSDTTGRSFGRGVELYTLIDKHGVSQCSRFGIYEGATHNDEDKTLDSITQLATLIVPMAFAVSLMHCKNVTITDATEKAGPSKKWLRRMKQPELRYYTLDIEPMKKILRKEGNIEANGLKKALHLCRGHFATYTEDAPLFGKIVGTFWKPQHVRGSKEFGEIKKDYRINTSSFQEQGTT